MPASEYYLPQRGLVEQQGAALIEPPQYPRSKFTGRKQRLTTFDAAQLIPFMVDEILPGDHMSYNVTVYCRMSTPLFPIYSTQRLQTFFFYCPSRILWEHWVNFMGEQENPTDSIAYTVPNCELPSRTGANVNDLFDQLGIPNQNAGGAQYYINSLPLRAYNKIWNAWFRDQNLQTSVTEDNSDGPDSSADYSILSVAKLHDYFTSALPWPQKFTSPTVPMTGLAPIQGLGNLNRSAYLGGPVPVYETAAGIGGTRNYAYYDVPGANVMVGELDASANPLWYASAGAANSTISFTINQFRQAYMIQSLLEREARGGTRYIEILKNEWGVQSPDFRLQRPEYIGGGSMDLMTTPVAQTAPSTGATVGTLGAATTGAGSHRATYAATEHGYIIGLLAVRTEQIYQQGLHRMWSRSTRYDFYNPAFAHLGEQAVRTDELYADGSGYDVVTFGYQEHWHEYRTLTSDTAGYFRSTTTTPLDAWHLAQKLSSTPSLNASFIVDTPPMSRILAAGTNANNAQYLADILIQRDAVRVMPAYGTPALLGRF